MTGVGVTPSSRWMIGLHPVGRQDLERRALGRTGQCVRVLAHVERAVRALAAPVVADRLGDGQDVGLGETCRAAAFPGGRWCRS